MPMSDQKQNRYARHLAGEYDSPSAGAAVAEAPGMQNSTGAAKGGRDVGTWDAYRNWLTKVQAPEQRRSLPDPALFSFKGYRSWAEKVRRDWEYEE